MANGNGHNKAGGNGSDRVIKEIRRQARQLQRRFAELQADERRALAVLNNTVDPLLHEIRQLLNVRRYPPKNGR